MAEATAPEPNRNFGDTQLDMSQPDGVPRERNSDGTFKEKPSETPAPSHPAYLSELAKSFGFDDDDMKAMSSEALGRAITRAQKRDAEWNQRFQSQPQSQQQVKTPEPEPEFDLGVDLKEYDEALAGAFDKLKQARIQDAKELKELRKSISENQERERARSHQQAIQIADDAFEALGPDYEEYFGKGSLADIQSNPTIFRRRVLALQETGVDVNVASGKQILNKLKKVADEILGVKPKVKEKEEEPTRPGRPTRREWNSGGTAVPTQRGNAEEPKGYERAVRNAERKAAANGGPVTPSHAKEDAEILATFPKR